MTQVGFAGLPKLTVHVAGSQDSTVSFLLPDLVFGRPLGDADRRGSPCELVRDFGVRCGPMIGTSKSPAPRDSKWWAPACGSFETSTGLGHQRTTVAQLADAMAGIRPKTGTSVDDPQCSTQWPSGSGGCLTLFAGSSTLRRLQWVVRFARKCNTAPGTLCTLVFLAIFMICSAAIYSLSQVDIQVFLVFVLCIFVQSFLEPSMERHRETAQTIRRHRSCTLFCPASGRFSDGLSESRRTARADGAGASSFALFVDSYDSEDGETVDEGWQWRTPTRRSKF